MSRLSRRALLRTLVSNSAALGALNAISCSSKEAQQAKVPPEPDAPPIGRPANPQFPLRIAPNGRYLTDANGVPFLVHGDTPWSIVQQLRDQEIEFYLNDRAAKGVTTIMFNAIEHKYTSQTPRYKNVDGEPPFATMPRFASGLNERYWRRVDLVIETAKQRGIACIVNPAYWGSDEDSEGWYREILAQSDDDLQRYGEMLARRYTQGNVIWCMGGDATNTLSERTKQWNIVKGIYRVRTTDLVMAHPTGPGEAYTGWHTFDEWNFNSTYFAEDDGRYFYEMHRVAYARPGPLPFILMESGYEQENQATSQQLRKQSYAALLSGACGQMFGNNPIWHFESPATRFPFEGTWRSNLDSVGNTQQQYVKRLFSDHEWWKLEPDVHQRLVRGPLGSRDSRVYAALADDRTFAMIFVPAAQQLTIAFGALAPARVRVRLFDPASGAYASLPGSPFPSAGIRRLAVNGERVVVLDAA